VISREKHHKLVKAGANVFQIKTEVTPELLAKAKSVFTKNGTPEVTKPVRYFADKYAAARARATLASLGASYTVHEVPASSVPVKDAMNG